MSFGVGAHSKRSKPVPRVREGTALQEINDQNFLKK